MTAINIQNRKWMGNKGEDLSNYLIGKPGVDASQLDGGVGRWTPYMYPGKLTNPVDIANEEISGTNLYGQELTNERNRLIRKNARLFDEGSYAGQVFNKIDQNLERTLPGEYFEIPQDMQPIVIKGKAKKQEGGSLDRTVTCYNCGHSWKLSDGGKDPMTCHKCGGQIKMKYGGQHGGLDRWFAEKWVDIKTGKACGRQEGESRDGYPACRPSKRVSSQTPKTRSEMSSSEKAKFKREKTSSQRISYNHKKNK